MIAEPDDKRSAATKPNSEQKPATKNPYGIRRKNGNFYCKYTYKTGITNSETHIWGNTFEEVEKKIESIKSQQ